MKHLEKPATRTINSLIKDIDNKTELLPSEDVQKIRDLCHEFEVMVTLILTKKPQEHNLTTALKIISDKLEKSESHLSPNDLQQIRILTNEFNKKVSTILEKTHISEKEEELPTGMTLKTILLPLEKLPLPEHLTQLNKDSVVAAIKKALRIRKDHYISVISGANLRYNIAEIIEIPYDELYKYRNISHKTMEFLTYSLALLGLELGTKIPRHIKLAYEKEISKPLDEETFQKLLLPIEQLITCNPKGDPENDILKAIKNLSKKSPTTKLIGDLIANEGQRQLKNCSGLDPKRIQVINQALLNIGVNPKLILSENDEEKFKICRIQIINSKNKTPND